MIFFPTEEKFTFTTIKLKYKEKNQGLGRVAKLVPGLDFLDILTNNLVVPLCKVDPNYFYFLICTMGKSLKKQYNLPPATETSVQQHYRFVLRDIFDKLSTDDLWLMAKCLIRLNLVGFCLSYCLEILEDRNALPTNFNDIMGN